MTRPLKVPDDRLVALVRAGRGTWRFTALNAAIVHGFGCHERHARLILAAAVKRGIIVKRDGCYGLPEMTGWQPGLTPPPPSETPPTYDAPPTRRIERNVGLESWNPLNRRVLLTMMRGRDWLSAEIEALACPAFGCTDATIRRSLGYALSYGYLSRDEHRRYHLTELAKRQLDHYGQLEGVEGVAFAQFCSGKPGHHLRLRKQRDAAKPGTANTDTPPAAKRGRTRPTQTTGEAPRSGGDTAPPVADSSSKSRRAQ